MQDCPFFISSSSKPHEAFVRTSELLGRGYSVGEYTGKNADVARVDWGGGANLRG